jgi:hypothetical protein
VVERLRNNLELKILSFAVALGAWAYLRLTPNPVISARFVQQFSVPLVTTGLREDEVANYTDRTALVSIEVPRGATAPIRPDSVRAVLNLADRGPGIFNVPIEVIAPNLAIKSLAPASETLTIERIVRKSVPVAVHYVGGSRAVVVDTVSVVPRTVTLRAPTSELRTVSSVRIDVPIPGSPSTFDAMMRPLPTDAHGIEVTNVDVDPNLMRVRVKFIAPKKS